MTTEQTPAQRMARITTKLSELCELGGEYCHPEYDIEFLLDRCRKLEKVAEAAIAPADWDYNVLMGPLRDALKEAGYNVG